MVTASIRCGTLFEPSKSPTTDWDDINERRETTMKRRSFLTRTAGLFSLLPASRSDAAQSQGATRAAGGCGPASLPFRAILAGYGDPRNRTSDFWQRET